MLRLKFLPLSPAFVVAMLSPAVPCLSAAGPDRKGAKNVSTERYQMLWDQGFDLPPGSHLRFVKIDTSPGANGTAIRYRVFAAAAEQGTPYTLSMWRIGTPIDDLEPLTESAYVNRKGLLLKNLPNPGQQDADALTDGSEVDVQVTAAKGEPVRFVLRTQDSKTMIGGTVVPYPLESAGKGCRLSALLADPDANSLLISADGFSPNSVQTLESSSQGSPQQTKIYTDARGHGSIVSPTHSSSAVAGTVTETIHGMGCAVSLSVPFGKGSYHPL